MENLKVKKADPVHNIKWFADYREIIKAELNDLQVIYTDMDGTLLNDKGCLIKDVEGRFYFDCIKLFERIHEKNIDMVLVSGRNKLQLRYNALLIGVKNYIAELGCELVHNAGEKVYVTFDESKYYYKITKGGSDLVKIIALFKKAFPGKIDSNIEWSMARAYNALFFGEIDLEKANLLLEENGYDGLSLVDNGFSKLARLDLDVNHLRIYNLIPKGVDKAVAMKLDRKIRDLKIENCIALGDSIEDLKMAGEVHSFFLMRDALDRDKSIINIMSKYNNVYVTNQKMNRGWAEVIKYLAH